MTHRLATVMESRPAVGWVGTFLSFLSSAGAWLFNHADDGAKIFGIFAAIFGCVAGYYTMRIQRRAWKRGEQRGRD